MTDRETIKLERKINSKKTVIRLMCRKGIRSFEIQETWIKTETEIVSQSFAKKETPSCVNNPEHKHFSKESSPEMKI